MDYTWIDASRKRVKLPAPQYIDYVLTWVEGLIKDEAVFPTKAGREFSPNFPSVARHIYTQLLRIFAHLYHAHYEVYLHLSMEGHLNSLFAHFLTFGREFDLLEPKECRAPKEGWPFVIGDLMDVSPSCWRDSLCVCGVFASGGLTRPAIPRPGAPSISSRLDRHLIARPRSMISTVSTASPCKPGACMSPATGLLDPSPGSPLFFPPPHCRIVSFAACCSLRCRSRLVPSVLRLFYPYPNMSRSGGRNRSGGG